MVDFSNFSFGDADTNAQGGSELIPDGTLAWAIVTIRPHNFDHGLCLVPSKTSNGKYLDVELTILEGPYARRKVWDKIGLEGSEKWVARGMSSVRHILEVGREITNYTSANPAYRLGQQSGSNGEMVFMELNELRCAVKIGIEKGKDGYQDKNVVRAYLSPNPTSDTHKTFQKLVAGDTAPAAKAAPAPAKPAWGGNQAQPAAQQQQQPGGKPAWAGNGPPKDSGAAPW